MTAIGFTPWKPAACACGSAHPCFSMTGPEGPWRCHQCHYLAIAAALAIPPRAPAEPAPAPARAPAPTHQGTPA